MPVTGGDGLHTAIGSWVWDAWTPDPAGTGGILTSDYVTIDWAKVDYLNLVGLFPWFTLPTAHRLVRLSTFLLSDVTVNNVWPCAPICFVACYAQPQVQEAKTAKT